MDNLKIEVKDTDIESKDWAFDGKSGTTRKQAAYVHGLDAYPQRIDIKLLPDQKPFAPGFYTLGLESFEIRKGQLGFAFPLPLIAVESVRGTDKK